MPPAPSFARTATKHALTANAAGRAKWAGIAIGATEAKTQLLQDINLINRTIRTLVIDDGKRLSRIPSGVELTKRLLDPVVTDADITSDAELESAHGDYESAEEAKG